MEHRPKTIQGRELCDLREQTAEPVFGIIEPVLGPRQFLLRRRHQRLKKPGGHVRKKTA